MGNGFKDKNGKFRPTKKKNGGVSLEEMYAKQVNEIIKNKKLHTMRDKPFIRNNIYMIDSNSFDLPSQKSIAEELAYKNVGFWGYSGNADEVDKLEKKALALADRYYDKMDEPNRAVDFLIKQKVGKNLDELVEDGYIRLDTDDVIHDLISENKNEN